MNGTIGVRANPVGGASFEFDVPLARVEATLHNAPLHSTPDEFESGTRQRIHVLIADDNATNRLVAANLCQIFGCTAESVSNGAEAIEAASSGRFDLVLMDIKMPVMDGVEATRAIRSRRGPVSQIPIIALTANADATDALFYRRSGMNGVVEKPINPGQLAAAMTAVLSATPVETPNARVA